MKISEFIKRHVPDSIFLKIVFKRIMGYPLNLSNPKTFNEKLQWLKLYNRNPLYTTLVDKSTVKKWVADKIGEKYLIPTLDVWNNFDEIDFDKLPNQFVLKCTHDSGSVVICKNKNEFDKAAARNKITAALKNNYYYASREWPYKKIKPRIIAEQYMEDRNGAFVDYKFSCFNGHVENVMVCLDRHINDVKFYFFDRAWNLQRLNIRGKNAPKDFTIPKPDSMDEMFDIAAKLSKDMPYVRVDLFECDGKIYFGEMTFFPDCGFDAKLLPETDAYFGKLLDLSTVKKK